MSVPTVRLWEKRERCRFNSWVVWTGNKVRSMALRVTYGLR